MAACSAEDINTRVITAEEPAAIRKIKIKIGSKAFTATLQDNAAATAFKEMLPMEIRMNDMNGNEKYYRLTRNIPTAESSPEKIKSGDLMMFGSNTFVLFYKSISTTYNYTMLGSIDNPSEIEAAVGSESVTVIFENLQLKH